MGLCQIFMTWLVPEGFVLQLQMSIKLVNGKLGYLHD